MALQKSVTTEQGVDANYHRVTDVKIYLSDPSNPRAIVELYLYKDAAARSGGSAPLSTKAYVLEGADYTTYFAPAALDVVDQNPFERAYVYLKTLTDPVDFTTGTTDV